MHATVHAACRAVLMAADPETKAQAALDAAADFAAGRLDVALDEVACADWPKRPARPARPELVPTNRVKRRSLVSDKGRASMLHALAHIEFNAIDLAFDLIGRFAHDAVVAAQPLVFAADWLRVGGEEAKHFLALSARLKAHGIAYGDLPAHDGLWRTAEATSNDLAARLAIAPLVLEARGLDVTPSMIAGLKQAGDPHSAATLEMIYADEIGHVAAGQRWFEATCLQRQIDPAVTFQSLVQTYYPGGLKEPFNTAARGSAGMREDWYAACEETR